MEAKEIKEINQHISDALEQWSNICLVADADEWSYYLNYSNTDALNSIFIVSHVLQNIAIKSGHIKDEKDALVKGNEFRKALKDYCGIDTKILVKKSLKEKEKWKSELEENT